LKDFVQDLTEWVVLPILTKKIHAYLLEDDVPDTVKQDRANEIMELITDILGFKPRKSRDKHLNALLTEREALILGVQNLIVPMLTMKS
jgi:tRNA A37 methylthiotransferase MiaB